MPEPALVLCPLSVGDEPQARAAHAELATEGFDFLLGIGDLGFAEYLDALEATRLGRDLPAGRVPATFLAAVVGDDVVGRVSIRHELNEDLARVGGHIGYAVRPQHRRRGYGTAILRRSLPIVAGLGVQRALVTCDDTNVASARTIERCHGTLQDVVDAAGTPRRRYWLRTDPGG